MLLLGFLWSRFREFERYFRIVVGLDEDAIQLTLKQCKSRFVRNEITPGIYTLEEFSDAVCTKGDREGNLQIKYDDISMKTKPILTRFGGFFGMLRFDEQSFSLLF